MDNFLFSINIVLPIVIMCCIGHLLKRMGVINDNFIDVSSKILFNLTIPCTMFSSIATSSLGDIFNLRLILFAVVSICIVAMILAITIPQFVKDKAKAASMVQGMFRSNFIMLGIPMAINMFGVEGSYPIMLVIPFAISLFNVLSVLIFVYMIPDKTRNESGMKASIKGIVKNPLIIASIVSIAFAFLPISLPNVIMEPIKSLGSITSPLAFLMMGACFELKHLSDNLKYTIISSIVRLIVIPIVVLSFAVAFDFRNAELGSLFLLFSAPTAVTSYILARNMGGDIEIAGQIVCITTLFSAITIVIGIYTLKTLALI